jgi:hypothetical protein
MSKRKLKNKRRNKKALSPAELFQLEAIADFKTSQQQERFSK